MVRILRGLAHKYFSDDEAVILFLILVIGTVFVILFGAMLAPAIASSSSRLFYRAWLPGLILSACPRVWQYSACF